jgi:AcrR family transcriptional regulator
VKGRRSAPVKQRKKTPRAPRGVPGESTRVRLVAAARALLEEGGYAAASVQAIAERTGVAAGALYRHFPSKAELFVEVFRDAAKRDLGAMQKAASDGGYVDRLEAAVATFARRALANRRLAWALVYEPLDALVDVERLAYRKLYCQGMASLIRHGIESGAIPRQDTDLAAAAVVGVIAETLVSPLSPIASAPRAEDALVQAIVTYCRRVVGLPDA